MAEQVTGISKKDFEWIEKTVDQCKSIRSETTSARTKLFMFITIAYMLSNYNVTKIKNGSKKTKV